MPKYLIEIEHENNKQACNLAVMEIFKLGSHFISHADWGCNDDVHKAWITIELENKEEALSIIPPVLRQGAKVVELNHYDIDDVDDLIALHS